MHLTTLSRHFFNCNLAFLILAVLCVSARYGVRWMRRERPTVSDVLILAACLLYIVFTTLLFVAVLNPIGSLELLDLAPYWPILEKMVKLVEADSILCGVIITLTKLSMFFFYRDIFPSRTFRRWINLGIIITICWWVSLLFALVFRCRPARDGWDVAASINPESDCFSYGSFVLVYELTNIAVDVYIILLPIPELRKLQMKTIKKVSVGLVFALGIFVIMTSAIRISVTFGHQVLPFTMTLLWLTVQNGAGIVCASLPALAPIIHIPFIQTGLRFVGKKFSSTFTLSGHRNKGSGGENRDSERSFSHALSQTNHTRNTSWYDSNRSIDVESLATSENTPITTLNEKHNRSWG